MERRHARLRGWVRRFWQGSHDHRGVPEAPGRVVTLIPAADAVCDGVAYKLDREVLERTFEHLDYREKNGYERHVVPLELGPAQSLPGETVQGVVYVAARGNFAYLGDAPLKDMVHQIRHARGPSGANMDYVLELARALDDLGAHDPHVFELAAALTKA